MSDGTTRWSIPDGYMPSGGEGDLASHESICVLNTAATDAAVTVTAYFEDREPLELRAVTIPGRRTRHVRTDELATPSGEKIPRGVPYAMVVEADGPISVQYSRMDSRSAQTSLMTAIAHPF